MLTTPSPPSSKDTRPPLEYASENGGLVVMSNCRWLFFFLYICVAKCRVIGIVMPLILVEGSITKHIFGLLLFQGSLLPSQVKSNSKMITATTTTTIGTTTETTKFQQLKSCDN